MMQLSIYAAFWIVYFVLHSALASNAVKRKFGFPNWYRLFYSSFSIITLIPILIYRLGLHSNILFETSLSSKLPAVALGYAAFILFKQSAKEYDIKAFIGFEKSTNSILKTEGILAKMRHPLYAATILLAIGFWLWTPTDTNLVMLATWFLYLPIGIRLEEKKLIAEFGKDYIEYQKKVSSIIPKIGFLRKN